MSLYPLSPTLVDKLAAWVERATDDEQCFKYVLSAGSERRHVNRGHHPERRVVLSLAHLAAALTRDPEVPNDPRPVA